MQITTSRRSLIRNSAVLTLFGAGMLVGYRSQLLRWLGNETIPVGEFTYVADIDYWQRTQRERLVSATGAYDLEHDLAAEIPMVLGEWSGEDKPQSNIEALILLDPEQYVRRLYQHRDGRYIWLSLIGGRSSKPFHPPDICYDADGWRTQLASKSISLTGGGDLYGLWLVANKEATAQTSFDEHIVFYFYLMREATRDHGQGIVLVKLTSSLYGSQEKTLVMHSEFLQHLFNRSTET